MKKQKRQYYRLEGNVLRSKLDVEYLKSNRAVQQAHNRSWTQKLSSYIPILASVTGTVFTNRMVISKLAPLFFSVIFSQWKKAKKINRISKNKLSHKLSKK